MSEPAIDIEITQPGRATGLYIPIEYDVLRLEKVLYPDAPRPFDVGILPKTLTEQGSPLRVILLGDISHPPKTQVPARLLGGFSANGAAVCLLAVPAGVDQFAGLNSFADLPDFLRAELLRCLEPPAASELQWLDAAEAQTWIKQAAQKYRLAKAKGYQPVGQPAWRSVDTAARPSGYTEVEHYTAAEYTFHQLPGHVQRYVGEYLADDERILYAVRRQAMHSQRRRSWLDREKLNEGVLILTTQRLIQLVELVPLGDSGVRYGFLARLGALERLVDVQVETLGDAAILLKTAWEAEDGLAWLTWESQFYTRSAVLELVSFLERFLPKNIPPAALRRSFLPAPSDLPPLSDPASNDPALVWAVHQRFTQALPGHLAPNEAVHAWALWPAWYENKGYPQVLVVTDRRVLILPDPALRLPCSLDIRLAQLAIPEYAGSILRSHIGFDLVESGKARRVQLSFPYPAVGAFRRCFEALRRCMAVLPLSRYAKV